MFQAIYQELKELGLENRLRDDGEVRHVLGGILALSCLPHNEILDAYQRLLYSISDRCREILHRFFRYFEDTWIGQVRPEGFSIFGVVNRTTSAVDLLVSRIKRILGADPPAFNFISKFFCFFF